MHPAHFFDIVGVLHVGDVGEVGPGALGLVVDSGSHCCIEMVHMISSMQKVPKA